jgi:UDP-N-acetylmuramyl pentapeptide phosphotransferase/UDP-N-acetylglucosamine-1-phosphate transferase
MLSSKNNLFYYILIASIFITSLLAFYFKPVTYYPNIEFTTADNVQVKHLIQASISKEICQIALSSLDEDLYVTCPNCKVEKKQCLASLTDEQQMLLSETPIPYPSIRLQDGVATYQSTNPQLALNTCLYTAVHSTNFGHQLKCNPSQTLRPTLSAINYNLWIDLLKMILMLVTAGVASWFICYLIIRYEDMHAHFSHDHTDAGPQKFHSLATPRIGGIALLAGLLATVAIEITFHTISPLASVGFSYFIIASLPVFFSGIIEDVTKNVGVAQRLLFAMLSASVAIWLLGAVINRVNIPSLDYALLWLPLAITLTIVAVSGTCNALNIIDGYNGLASGYAVIVLIALSYIAFLVNDHLVIVIAIAMMGSLLGFLIWNWPYGRIFMGDGGAYLLGFTLAELAVLLIYRNPSVSPWAVFSLLAYPVFETLFSMYRRKFIHKAFTGHPDALHLHQLIFIKILHGQQHTDPQKITACNSRVAPYIWATASINAIIVACFWQNTPVLMLLSVAGCVLYVIIYYKLTSLPD